MTANDSPIVIHQLRSPSLDVNYQSPSPLSSLSPSPSSPRPQSVGIVEDSSNEKSPPGNSNGSVNGTGGELVSRYKNCITSERLAQLRKMVDEAIKEHRVFTIRGGWQTLRRAFLRRNWIEKCECANKAKPPSASASNLEELCVNLPTKQTWETPSAHILKCERTIMSRLLQVHDVDFYWNTRKDNHDMQFRLSCNKLMSRFSRSLFTSKEGLCLLLQQMYWHNEPGVATVYFPRCYVLGFPDHYNNFIDDFRLTACMSLLRHTIHLHETQDQYAIQSPEGLVPYSAFQFAMDRLNEFLATKKHMDIDVDIPSVDDTDWSHFLDHFQLIVHDKQRFLENKNYVIAVLVAAGRAILKKLLPYWPQMNLDGMRNIWIMKPGNKCRGRGIQLIKDVKDVGRIMDMKLKYVVQKYIERPLIIFNTKFDIRQWFLITSVQPLVIWMYKESYLRFSSQTFNLDNFHESLHLTNHAVQCKYKNTVDRDKALPEDNMWDCYTFQTFLKNTGQLNKWESVIYPGMKESIIGSMLSCQDTMDRRPNTFELYGADFILAEDYKPWLLEINSSPDLSSSTSVTARMCPQCLEDLVKVVIDRKRDPNCDTGYFVCVYKQNFPRPPAYLGMSLSVRGRRIFKRSKNRKDKENETNCFQRKNMVTKKNSRLSAPFPSGMRLAVQDSTTDNQAGGAYNGPVIADLMEEIQKSSNSLDDSDPNDGIEVAQPVKQVLPKKRSKPVAVVSHTVSNISNRHNQQGGLGIGALCPRVLHRSQVNPRSTPSSRSSRRSGNSRTPRTAPRLSSRPFVRRQPPATSRGKQRAIPGVGERGDNEQQPERSDGNVSMSVIPTRKKFNKDRSHQQITSISSTKQNQQVQRVAFGRHSQLESLELLEKLKALRALQLLQVQANVKKAEFDDNKLLTVGKSLGRLMCPHT